MGKDKPLWRYLHRSVVVKVFATKRRSVIYSQHGKEKWTQSHNDHTNDLDIDTLGFFIESKSC